MSNSMSPDRGFFRLNYLELEIGAQLEITDREFYERYQTPAVCSPDRGYDGLAGQAGCTGESAGPLAGDGENAPSCPVGA